MPLIVLVWVVRRWLQIVLADASVGGGFFNGLLDDQHLLLVSEQLRDLLAGNGWDDNQGPGSAALPISLLLLSEAGAERLSKGFDVAMSTLHEAMTLLSITIDREIVSRILHRKDGPTGAELMESLRVLTQNDVEPGRSPRPA